MRSIAYPLSVRLAAWAMLLSLCPAAMAAERLSVDLGSDTGAFHGGASGSLYGLYDAHLPFPNLVQGIHLRSVATKAQDGPQHPGADALEVNRLIADASGGDTYIYMTDRYREFPYHWMQGDCAQSLARYLDIIAQQVQQVKALAPNYRDRMVFVPFNEPEGNMFAKAGHDEFGNLPQTCNGISWRQDPSAYFDAWDRAYRLIRRLLPGARIAGPNTSRLYDEDLGFLQHAVQAGTVPDVFTWHELSNPSALSASVARYRGWEDRVFAGTALAGRHLPINIDEYAFNYHTSVPGQMVQWIAAIETSKVDADIAYWNIDGNLSDSAVQANRGNGQWWLLNRYTAMRGHTLQVIPPHPGQDYTLQGLATLDPQQAQARVLFGGASGAASVALTHVPTALFGQRARVLVRAIDWTGQLGDARPPRLVADLVVPVSDAGIALEFGTDVLPPLSAETAYELILTPGAHGGPLRTPDLLWQQDLEAEAAAHTGSGYERRGPEGSPQALDRFFTSGGHAVGGFASGSDLALGFAVDVPCAGHYALRILANTFNQDPKAAEQGPTNLFVRIDGDPASEREVLLPLGYKPVVWDHADLALELTKGQHVITLATTSHDGRGHTSGNALVDRIRLSLPDPDAGDTRYEAEFAELDGAQAHYDRDDVSGAGAVALPPGASATFWVYAAQDGPAHLTLDWRGGEIGIAANGHALAPVASQTAFLLGGINKITVTGHTGTAQLDRLRVSEVDASARGRRYEAEQAILAGTVHVAAASLASGGQAVFGIGGTPGNANTLTFPDLHVDHDGVYALTVRYSNPEQSKATHYNPDPLARIARLSVNGAAAFPVTFPHSFHRNNWWELSIPVTLHAGRNTLRIAGEEAHNADGRSYASQTWPGILLRSREAPNIDWITLTPLQGAAAP